jgi:tRNA threonylcarbamoyladenosine modification (KEOPS) complex  Pcc1 subunit
MKTSAKVRLKFPSEKQLDIVFEALTPETRTSYGRSKATLEKEGLFLILKVEAEDTVAVRATLNAYLRWISSVVSVLEVLQAK